MYSYVIFFICYILQVPQHVSDEDPVFNRTLRALKSHPNARHDDDDGDDVVDYDVVDDGDEEVEEEKVPIPGWMIFVQIQDILEQGRNLFLRRSHRPRPSMCS